MSSIKNELGGKMMKKFVGLRARMYIYLTDVNDDSKKAKGTKNCAIKRKPKFKNYKNCLHGSWLENKINYLEENKIDKKGIIENHRDFIKK